MEHPRGRRRSRRRRRRHYPRVPAAGNNEPSPPPPPPPISSLALSSFPAAGAGAAPLDLFRVLSFPR